MFIFTNPRCYSDIDYMKPIGTDLWSYFIRSYFQKTVPKDNELSHAVAEDEEGCLEICHGCRLRSLFKYMKITRNNYSAFIFNFLMINV